MRFWGFWRIKIRLRNRFSAPAKTLHLLLLLLFLIFSRASLIIARPTSFENLRYNIQSNNNNNNGEYEEMRDPSKKMTVHVIVTSSISSQSSSASASTSANFQHHQHQPQPIYTRIKPRSSNPPPWPWLTLTSSSSSSSSSIINPTTMATVIPTTPQEQEPEDYNYPSINPIFYLNSQNSFPPPRTTTTTSRTVQKPTTSQSFSSHPFKSSPTSQIASIFSIFNRNFSSFDFSPDSDKTSKGNSGQENLNRNKPLRFFHAYSTTRRENSNSPNNKDKRAKYVTHVVKYSESKTSRVSTSASTSTSISDDSSSPVARKVEVEAKGEFILPKIIIRSSNSSSSSSSSNSNSSLKTLGMGDKNSSSFSNRERGADRTTVRSNYSTVKVVRTFGQRVRRPGVVESGELFDKNYQSQSESQVKRKQKQKKDETEAESEDEKYPEVKVVLSSATSSFSIAKPSNSISLLDTNVHTDKETRLEDDHEGKIIEKKSANFLSQPSTTTTIAAFMLPETEMTIKKENESQSHIIQPFNGTTKGSCESEKKEFSLFQSQSQKNSNSNWNIDPIQEPGEKTLAGNLDNEENDEEEKVEMEREWGQKIVKETKAKAQLRTWNEEEEKTILHEEEKEDNAASAKTKRDEERSIGTGARTVDEEEEETKSHKPFLQLEPNILLEPEKTENKEAFPSSFSSPPPSLSWNVVPSIYLFPRGIDNFHAEKLTSSNDFSTSSTPTSTTTITLTSTTSTTIRPPSPVTELGEEDEEMGANENESGGGGGGNVRGYKFGYFLDEDDKGSSTDIRKYRIEERTNDGFIVGEYGVINQLDNGFVRGVRYTADGTINPRLIHEALMKFLQL